MPALTNAFWLIWFRLYLLVRSLLFPASVGAVGMLRDEQGRVLLVRHSYMPGWQLPGGGVGRGEPPAQAVLRELAEELGMEGGEAGFVNLYVRRTGWVASFVALYRITGGTVHFRPNLEIREICYADPAAPPAGCASATLRRLAELNGAAPSSYW